MTLLGSPHRSLLNEPILEGYAVLPSVEFAHNHTTQLLGLADEDYMLGSDYESGDEEQDIPEGLMGEVLVGELDVSQESTISDSQGTEVNPEHRSDNSSMLTDTPEELRVPIVADPAAATRMTVEKLTQI